MANRGRLRPADAVVPEYLENPFLEAGTEIRVQPVPFRFPLAFLAALPEPVLLSPRASPIDLPKLDFHALTRHSVDFPVGLQYTL